MDDITRSRLWNILIGYYFTLEIISILLLFILIIGSAPIVILTDKIWTLAIILPVSLCIYIISHVTRWYLAKKYLLTHEAFIMWLNLNTIEILP